MHLRRAVAYLKNVTQKKELVPFRRYCGGPARHAQVCIGTPFHPHEWFAIYQ